MTISWAGPARSPTSQALFRRSHARRADGRDLATMSDAELAALLREPGQRDSACEELVARYQTMVNACAYHYHLPAQYTEELIQVGYVGLLKAINNYDPGVSEKLAGYAQACISGEIKRFFRDKRWQLRIRRTEQELLLRARQVRADLIQELGAMPDDAQVARRLNVGVKELAAADQAAQAFTPASLDAAVPGHEDLNLSDVLGAEDPGLERTLDLASVAAHWSELGRREQYILTLRFYGNMTQAEIAGRLGCSQMHVSRLQARALRHLRDRLLVDEPG